MWQILNAIQTGLSEFWYLNDEIHMSFVFITGGRSVRSDNQLSVYPGGQVDVLSDGKTEDMFGRRKLESEATSVMTQHFSIDQFQRIFGIGIWKT